MFLVMLVGCNSTPPIGVSQTCWDDSIKVYKIITNAMDTKIDISEKDNNTISLYIMAYANTNNRVEKDLTDLIFDLNQAEIDYFMATIIKNVDKQNKAIKEYNDINMKIKSEFGNLN